MKEHILTSRRNQNITVKLQGSVIKEIDNQTGIRFPFAVGSNWNMSISTWACNNNFKLNGQDPCPEEKIFGIKKSQIPMGHELRSIYPGKFAVGGKLARFEKMAANLDDSIKEKIRVQMHHLDSGRKHYGSYGDGGELSSKSEYYRNRFRKALALAKGEEDVWAEEWKGRAISYNKPVPKFVALPPDKAAEIVGNIKRWFDVIVEYEDNKDAIIIRKEQKEGLSHSAKLNLNHASGLLTVLIDSYATGYHPNCQKTDRAKEKERIEDTVDLLIDLIAEDKAYFSQKMTEAIDSKLSDLEILQEELTTLSGALEYLTGKDKKVVSEKMEIIKQALDLLEPVIEVHEVSENVYNITPVANIFATKSVKTAAGIETLKDWKSLFAAPEKFMKYDGQFLYPPRIKTRLQPTSLDKLDTGEYIGQPKLNGSNTSLAISETTAIAKERHNTFFSIPPKFDFKSMHRGAGWLSFAGEFMNKSKKDQNGQPFRGFCIWDIMAYENLILIGSTPTERIKLLNLLYPATEPAVTINGIILLYYTATPGIFRMHDFYDNFHEVYNQIIGVDMIEGFVMKRKNGKLENMTREDNNVGWAVKVRKPTANYHFARGGEMDGFRVGTKVGMMRGEHKGEKGYVIDTEYVIKLSDDEIVHAHTGDFYKAE